MPPTWSRVTALMVVLVTGFVIFAFSVGFARKETVRGRLRPTEAEARIYAPQPGTVMRLHVSLDDDVPKGALLAEVRTSPQIAANVDMSQQTVAALLEEQTMVRVRKEAALREGDLNKQRLAETIETEKQETERLKGLIDLTAQRIQIARERLDSSVRLVEQGAASKEEKRVREDALIVQQQQNVELNGRLAESQARSRSAALELRRADQIVRRESADISQRLAQIDAQMARVQAEGGFVLQAPVDGRVAAIQVADGQRVDPTRPLLAILPHSSVLQAETFVPSRAIAFIEIGQKVRLRFDALPYQKFGSVMGTVSQISKAAFAPQELNPPLEIEEPVYRVFVELDRQAMPAFGKEVALQAGMELSADIVLENRLLVEWLLEPIFAATARMGEAQ